MQLELFEENCGGIGLDELFQAYYDCRKNKRKTFNALEFEADYENRLLEADFISDSYSCREGKGVQYGIKCIAEYMYLCSEGYTKDCYILKMDIQSFFMSIDKRLLLDRLPGQFQKFVFVQDRYAQFLRFFGFGTGVRADDDIIGILGNRTGHFGAERKRFGFGFGPRQAFQRPGKDHRLAGNRRIVVRIIDKVFDLHLFQKFVNGSEVVL